MHICLEISDADIVLYLGEHRIIFQFRFSQWWTIARDDDQFCYTSEHELARDTFTTSELFQTRLVSEGILSRLHDERKARVYRLRRLL
jgi:hypothetical protein